MSKLSLEEVAYIADLARLGISDEEKEMFRNQLSDILSYMEKLNELDTSQVEPTSSAVPLTNVMREDQAAASMSPREVLSNAPDSEDDQFKVQAILE